MKKLVAFAFARNISAHVLHNLDIESKFFLYPWTNLKSYRTVAEQILTQNPTHILGLGMYSGRNKEVIRIESQCTNKFRKDLLGVHFDSIELSSWMLENENMKITRGMGISFCNLMSYVLLSTIRENDYSCQYTFLHIPKSFKAKSAVEMINKQLVLIQ